MEDIRVAVADLLETTVEDFACIDCFNLSTTLELTTTLDLNTSDSLDSLGVSLPRRTGNATDASPSADIMANVIGAITLIIVCAVILFIEFGNLMTIGAFLSNQRLRRPRYIPVVSMAVSDLLYGLSTIFVLFIDEVHRRATEQGHKAFSFTVTIMCNIFADASAWHLVVLAVDRFIAVRFPMSYRGLMTSRCITKMTIGCWLIAVVLACPYLMWVFVDVRSVTDSNVTCYHYQPDVGPIPLKFDFTIQFSQYLAISATIVILSLGVLVVAWGSHLQRQQNTRQDTNRSIHGTRSIG
jgi:lysylphosphatidylglycerol synthetase-like protein (DUF2156 family)